MEFTTGSIGTKLAARVDLTITLSYNDLVMQGTNFEVGARFSSFDTALLEPGDLCSKEMDRGMVAHRTTKGNKYANDTVVESESDATDYEPQPLSWSVDRPLLESGSNIELALADLGVVTKTDAEGIVEIGLNK